MRILCAVAPVAIELILYALIVYTLVAIPPLVTWFITRSWWAVGTVAVIELVFLLTRPYPKFDRNDEAVQS